MTKKHLKSAAKENTSTRSELHWTKHNTQHNWATVSRSSMDKMNTLVVDSECLSKKREWIKNSLYIPSNSYPLTYSCSSSVYQKMRTIFNLICQRINFSKSNAGQSPLSIYAAIRVRRVG
jgi:hypothetical protein